MTDEVLLAVDPLICPLCRENNACMNLSCADSAETCWCNNPEIKFPKTLLDKIPSAAKGQACICLDCAVAHQN